MTTAELSVDDGSIRAEDLVPVQVGDLWIVPAAFKGALPPEATNVLTIETSNVFGSGNHPTTSLIIERMYELSPFSSVLDVGVGSGVLSLAALRFGAERVIGSDVSKPALEVARRNAERNGLANRLELTTMHVDQMTGAFDCIVANIRGPELMQIATGITRLLGAGGVLMLSGVRRGEAADVSRQYKTMGLRTIAEHERSGWVMIELLASW